MEKSEEWQKNAHTVQQYQGAATAGLVYERRAARESNINMEWMNKEVWNVQAAKCYMQRSYPHWRNVDTEISRKLCKAK
jgi:hypothetical protein